MTRIPTAGLIAVTRRAPDQRRAGQFRMSSAATRAHQPSDRFAISELLSQGGDERILPDPRTGRNRYGCRVEPEVATAAFASTTASTISASAYDDVAAYLDDLRRSGPAPDTYRRAAQEARERLARLCGLPARSASNIVLAPSGTDLHLMAADLARGAGTGPLVTVMADPSETGRGVPQAVRGMRFGTSAPHGTKAEIGEILPGAVAGESIAVELRRPDGTPRTPGDVEADFERACRQSIRSGRRVLLILVDVSKSGLIAPSPASAIDLKRRFGEALTVLVDACQFRLSPESLADYLAADFLVAITGSKFVGGPPFSGALLVPDLSAPRLKAQPLLPALAEYSGREDWACDFTGRTALPDLANFGMLARWRAALHELEALRSVPEADIGDFLGAFAGQVEASLDTLGVLERVETPPLARLGGGWDRIQTIFPFRVSDGTELMGLPRLQAFHNRLRRPAGEGELAVQLGQPVTIGWDAGQPRVALRVSASAPLIVEALKAPDRGKAVLARVAEALAITADLARRF
ncbi:hypothetical protein [Phenylobacterium sp.]|uniref:hypothetical protein n=1 Tax=Phenylobacterium sp. TaxID=1871053 RepID=UPI0025D04455|nr:hypothetical protein [Phenylobacterium sp.]